MPSKYEAVSSNDKYQSVDLQRSNEKFEDESQGRRSISESLGSTLLEEERTSPSYRRQSSGKWIWLVHTVLLLLSFTMFISSAYTRSSTLKHVQDFSAYCEFNYLSTASSDIKIPILTSHHSNGSKSSRIPKCPLQPLNGNCLPLRRKRPRSRQSLGFHLSRQ